MRVAQSLSCDCEPLMRAACAGNPIYERHQGRAYCVLHFPQKKSQSAFEAAVKKKLMLKDYDFSGVWFPDEVVFDGFHFEKDAVFTQCTFLGDVSFNKSKFAGKADFSASNFQSDLNFSRATAKSMADFSGTTFEQFVDFTATEFEAAVHFDKCTFNGVAIFSTGFGGHTDLAGIEFNEWAEFNACEFKNTVSFLGTVFHKSVDFSDTTFDDEVNFGLAVFSDSVTFGKPDGGREVFGDQASLSLENARIDVPQRFSFHSMRLKPSWFINVDARKFDFTNVSWFETGINENFPKYGRSSRLLAIAYRHLAVNAEENHRYREASNFRYLAMDVHRLERTRPSRINWGKMAFWELTWWYWLASGYGERVLRASIGLFGIWLLFALVFSQVGFVRDAPASPTQASYDTWGEPLPFPRALTYSAAVITLRNPDPKPRTNTAQAAVLLATILGPIQGALLALAIRRKFIR